MSNIKLDISNTGVPMNNILEYAKKVEEIHKDLHAKKDDEKEFLGWLELPTNYDKEEFSRIKKAAKKIQKD